MNIRLKKILSCVLTTVILIASVPVAAFGGVAPLKITVAADTHFQCAADLGDFSDQYTEYMLEPELFGYASTQGQMPYESEAILCEMLTEFEASASDCLLIAGDLTCGKRASALSGNDALTKRIAAMPVSILKRQIAEKTALALLETLTGGFIDDYSAPEDLNVTLPTGKTTNAVTLHILIRIFRLFAELLNRLFNV